MKGELKMPKSLEARFDGNAQEVVSYAQTWGIFQAMEKYQVRDYLAFKGFLEEKTDNKNFGLSPLLGAEMGRSWAEDLLDAFIGKISKMEAERQRLETELHSLNLRLEYFQGHQARRLEPRIQGVLAKCQI